MARDFVLNSYLFCVPVQSSVPVYRPVPSTYKFACVIFPSNVYPAELLFTVVSKYGVQWVLVQLDSRSLHKNSVLRTT
jgi:hypothetical protein